MKVIDYQAANLPQVTSATVGTFDGVHKGHQQVIGLAVARARELGGKSCVITFDKLPRQVLSPAKAPAVLTALQTKLSLIGQLGVDYVLLVPFTRELAKLAPDEFCTRVIAGQLGVKHLFVGVDFRFGADRQGDAETLVELGQLLGFTASPVSLLEAGGSPVSSTRIRGLLTRGKVREVLPLLGRYHAATGYVEKGHQRGAQIGFPTINVLEDEHLCLPRNGVYAGMTTLADRTYPSVANVGVKPTFGEDKRQLEAHLFGYAGKAYGERVSFDFRFRLRDEQRFGSLAELREQISSDAELARRLLVS